MYDRIPAKEEIEQALAGRYGRKLQKKMQNTGVAICGLGGLGSNIAIILARAGIGRLHLMDYDRVELSNIHRQQYRISQIGTYKTEALRELIKEIAPYTEVKTDTVKITEDNYVNLLKGERIICEAFDAPEAKAMLVNGILEKLPEKYVVAASGMAGFASANDIRTRRITSRFYLCGDEKSDIGDGMQIVASRVMLCAAHQAHTVLQLAGKRVP